MMRTRGVGVCGVRGASCSYLWVVGFHTHVVPSKAGGTTLALIPLEKVAAPARSACIRAAAFVRSALEMAGGLKGAARTSMPIRLGAAAGEPVAVSLTLLKLWNVGESRTPDTGCKSLLTAAGAGRGACGPVVSLQG